MSSSFKTDDDRKGDPERTSDVRTDRRSLHRAELLVESQHVEIAPPLDRSITGESDHRGAGDPERLAGRGESETGPRMRPGHDQSRDHEIAALDGLVDAELDV